MKITEYYKPLDVRDAYEKLIGHKKATLMAGGMYLRLQKRTLPLVIDLEALKLNSIVDLGDEGFKIGAMTTLRSIERSEALPACLSDSVRQVGGLSLRNMATIGGSIMGRYPFSDINTALLALDATLQFHIAGNVALATFLEEGMVEQDILTHILIKKPLKSVFKAYKATYTDFSLVNMAFASVSTGGMRIAFGARPGRCEAVSLSISGDGEDFSVDQEWIEEAIMSQFKFGTDYRASGEYRKALALTLLEDAIKEVL